MIRQAFIRTLLMLALIGTLSVSGYAQCDTLSDFEQPYVPDGCTILLFHCDEGTGDTAYDASVHNNDGIIYGAEWAGGMFDGGLCFDSAGVYGNDSVQVTLDDVNFMAGSHTWEAWIKLLSLDTLQTVMAMGGGHDQIPWYIHSDGSVSFRVVHNDPNYHEEVYSKLQLQINTWYHVACVWDNDDQEVSIYINGYKDNSRILSYTPSVPQYNFLEIGKLTADSPSSPRSFFHGYIDEVRISNIARRYQHPLPTLGEWGFLILGILCILSLIFMIKRKRAAVCHQN